MTRLRELRIRRDSLAVSIALLVDQGQPVPARLRHQFRDAELEVFLETARLVRREAAAS